VIVAKDEKLGIDPFLDLFGLHLLENGSRLWRSACGSSRRNEPSTQLF
jgi:hypothetical protein